MYKTLDDILSEMPKARRDKIIKKSQVLLLEEADLKGLRKKLKTTQEKMSSLLKVKQAAISKFERRKDMHIESLKSYIEALGGNLKLIATFPGMPPIEIKQ
jgi:DNA-binding XRE family transcriptional regulator